MFYEDRAHIIGERIKEKRKRLGLTQKELLEKVYLSEKSVASLRKWENGERLPDLETIARMCEVFGCDLGYLLGDYEEADYPIHKICEYTGLSENAVSILNKMRKHNEITWKADIANAMISHPMFQELLSYMILFATSGDKKSDLPNSDIPIKLLLKDVYHTRINDLVSRIISDLSPFFEVRPDYRWMYEQFLVRYRNKDRNGNYHSLEEIKEKMEQNGLKYDELLFEGERE